RSDRRLRPRVQIPLPRRLGRWHLRAELRGRDGVLLGEALHPVRRPPRQALRLLSGSRLHLTLAPTSDRRIGNLRSPAFDEAGERALGARRAWRRYSSRTLARNSQPDTAPAMVGTMRNSHSCASAWPPTNTAGPRLRAGFTERPVTLMKGKCSTTSVRP